MMLSAVVFVALLGVACISVAAAGQCPPPRFDSVAGFSLEKFIQGPWFVQEQMITAYQRENQLYCVQARYEPQNPATLNAGINVINAAREGSVAGNLVGSSGSGAASSSSGLLGGSFGIVAFPAQAAGSTAASKLHVGPSFLAGLYKSGLTAIFGPYWVVAVGESADRSSYEWAIVSGGPPKTSTTGGCVAGPVNPTMFDVNGAGLWLFSRKPVDPVATAAMRKEAARLGFDTAVLRQVTQQGCSYPAAAAAAPAAASGSTLAKKITLG